MTQFSHEGNSMGISSNGTPWGQTLHATCRGERTPWGQTLHATCRGERTPWGQTLHATCLGAERPPCDA